MKRIFYIRILALLFLLPFGVEAQKLKNFVLANTVAGGAPPPTPSDFYHTTITVPDGNANAFVFVPEDVDNPPSGGWPLFVHLNGDGTSNNTTNVVTGQAMSTSDNLTYSHTRSASLFRIMTSTVRIKVNGVEVARARAGGTITGTGITGSITNFNVDNPTTTTTPTVSVTFSSSQAGNTITYDMVESTMVSEGPTRYINLGDELDNRTILIAIQNINSINDLERAYVDNVVTYAWNNFTINPKRLHAPGISRGGRQIIETTASGANSSVLKTRNTFWIETANGAIHTSAGAGRVEAGFASLVTGTASYGGSFTVGDITDFGQLLVHAYVDATLANGIPTYTSTLSSANEPPFALNYPGPFVGSSHSYELWDLLLYNRQWITVGTGTSQFDYVDFLLKYSKDPLERATLFVEQAEKRRYGTEKDIIDYRHAARQVATLSASAEKTALEGRLATLKPLIENGGTRWVINFHSAGEGEASPYNNFASSTAGTTVSNLVDFDGNATGLDIELDTNPGGGMAVVGSSRRSWTGGFSKTANNSGLVLTGFPFGTFKFTDVPSGTYTVRFYHNVGVANFSTDPRLRVTLNSETKATFSAINTLLGYIEFTNVPHTALAQFDTSYDTSANTILTIMEIYKHP